jgi:hypothetical protein
MPFKAIRKEIRHVWDTSYASNIHMLKEKCGTNLKLLSANLSAGSSSSIKEYGSEDILGDSVCSEEQKNCSF